MKITKILSALIFGGVAFSTLAGSSIDLSTPEGNTAAMRKILCDVEDPKIVLAPRDAQKVTTGPKHMIVHIGDAWIEMDIVVAHVPLLGYQTIGRCRGDRIRLWGISKRRPQETREAQCSASLSGRQISSSLTASCAMKETVPSQTGHTVCKHL